ncbi:hypothetical protein D915_004998 [Fasciola hepatica]|uniref:Protein MIS12 homolog n=1 Tax=Fasciola hepatica TaxID=6192 RepID=A0A4E0R9T1_FASHE|nr:hypothetical protein D915_004998 [Fasciola hepatica]
MSEKTNETEPAEVAGDEEEKLINEEHVELAIESVQEPAAKILGFAPLQLADDVFNVVNEKLGQMIDEFSKKLSNKYGTKANPERMEKLIDMYKYKLQAQQDYLFDQFDKLLVGKLLFVEPNVVLEEDRCQLRYSEKRDKITEERIDTYSKRLVALNTCQVAMENEMRELEAVQTNICAIRDSITRQIQQTFNLNSVDDLCLLVREQTCSLHRILTDLGTLFQSSAST